MAPLCKFYQQGNCRNGANCRFEHSNANPNPFGAPSSSNTNRFGALSNSGGGGGGAGGAGGPAGPTNQYKVTKDSIKIDLADERPSWILSCYGPGRDAPEQLFGGYPREQSLEEVRLYVTGSANPQQAFSEVQGLYQQAEQQIQTTLNNLDGAVQFVLAADNKHPNRIDLCNQNTVQGGTNGVFARNAAQQGGDGGGGFSSNPSSNPFGAASSTPSQNPFQSASQPNPFGNAGSGNTTGPSPAFGQPSALGQKPNPFASSNSPAFGQPSQMGASGPAFGKPSQMGATAPAFGQPSQLGSSGPAFGQTSALGQKPNPFASAAASSSAAQSGFGQVAATQNTQSAFGQPSGLGQKPNPFGAPATSSPAPNPFGQPATAPAANNPFAQAQQNNNTLATTGQPMNTTAAAPAQNNPFGQPANTGTSGFPSLAGAAKNPNPFGQPAQPTQQTTSPFGVPTANNTAASNPFAQPQAPPQQIQAHQAQAGQNNNTTNNPYGPNSKKQHPPLSSYSSRGLDGRLTAWMGQPVTYRWKVQDGYEDRRSQDASHGEQPVPGVRNPNTGKWRKIIFPDGPPAYNPDTEPVDPGRQYTDAVREVYARMAVAGRFEGDVPEVPPLREDCAWAF